MERWAQEEVDEYFPHSSLVLICSATSGTQKIAYPVYRGHGGGGVRLQSEPDCIMFQGLGSYAGSQPLSRAKGDAPSAAEMDRNHFRGLLRRPGRTWRDYVIMQY